MSGTRMRDPDVLPYLPRATRLKTLPSASSEFSSSLSLLFAHEMKNADSLLLCL